MLHGLAGVPTAIPLCLHPLPLSMYDTRPAATAAAATGDSPTAKAPGARNRKRKEERREEEERGEGGEGEGRYWSRLGGSSESSDYSSDPEGAGHGMLKSLQAKVRRSALNCFHKLIKVLFSTACRYKLIKVLNSPLPVGTSSSRY